MKFLFRPLDATVITQYFGENKACMPINGGAVITCDGLNPPTGYQSIYSNMNGHNGLDMMAVTGLKIYSSQDGIVDEYVSEPARGVGLGIVTTQKFYCDELDKEVYWKIRYWHNKLNLVNVGDKITIGQVIALTDNTGYSSGSHLHFEVKPVDVVFNKDGSIKKVTNILQDNGYFGAINPLPYLRDECASEYTVYKSWKERLIYVLLKYLH